ncbi:hypothetical protein BDZ91DRAFT_510508 [Kalaharituber pfeilii]|nr:hypothetical protein BDZ91DRAFT_510508 [Kalaharituber pfeilii]
MIIFGNLTSYRRNKDLNVGLIPAVTVAFMIILIIGLCSQQAHGFEVIPHNGAEKGGAKEWFDPTKLKSPKDIPRIERSGSWVANESHFNAKRSATYDPTTGMCICDSKRSFSVHPSLPPDQRPGYCVQICGAPLDGVATNPPATASSVTQEEASATTSTLSEPDTTSVRQEESIISDTAIVGPTPPAAPTAPTAPVAPTAPAAPTAPTAPGAPTAPSPPSTNESGQSENVNSGGSGSGKSNNNGYSNDSVSNGASGGAEDNTALKIGVGLAVGVIVSGLVAVGVWIFLRKREAKKRQEEDEITFGCVGTSDVHPALRGEKFIYAAPGHFNHSKSSIHVRIGSKGDAKVSPPSPQSIPPAYTASAAAVIPSTTNSSSTSIDTNPPILPLGAPSRVLDLNAPRTFVPSNLVSKQSPPVPPHAATAAVGSASRGPVQPPSITFFLHPVKDDRELEEEERKWLDDEQRRIREKKEAVEELNKLREEEEKIREKIREKMNLKNTR